MLFKHGVVVMKMEHLLVCVSGESMMYIKDCGLVLSIKSGIIGCLS